MKKTFVISLVLCGCVQYSGSQSHQAENAFMTPMTEYRKCMGYSDNSITYTSDNSARYIVLSSEKSIEQPFSNKQEHGQVYYTSLLLCPSGNTIKECSEQQSLIIHGIGTKTKWSKGDIKNFDNADLMFDKTVRSQFLSDGKFVKLTDYCYIDRNNITKTYCGHFIRKSDWRVECKSKLMGVEDNM